MSSAVLKLTDSLRLVLFLFTGDVLLCVFREWICWGSRYRCSSSSVIGTIITCCGGHGWLAVVVLWGLFEFSSIARCFEQQLYGVNVVSREQIKQVAHRKLAVPAWRSQESCSWVSRAIFLRGFVALSRRRDAAFSSSESDRTIYVLLFVVAVAVVVFGWTHGCRSRSSSSSSHRFPCILRSFSRRRPISELVGVGDAYFRFSERNETKVLSVTEWTCVQRDTYSIFSSPYSFPSINLPARLSKKISPAAQKAQHGNVDRFEFKWMDISHRAIRWTMILFQTRGRQCPGLTVWTFEDILSGECAHSHQVSREYPFSLSSESRFSLFVIKSHDEMQLDGDFYSARWKWTTNNST